MWDRGRVSFRGAAWPGCAARPGTSASARSPPGCAWFLAHDVVGHPQPFFAPIVAVVCLGTSYGQRLRRVAEVTIGVAIGVFLADLLLLLSAPAPGRSPCSSRWR